MKPTRLWLDGCFDGFHYAHANAIRQALSLVDGPVRMVVGVHPDTEIALHKGPPLFDERERCDAVASCRWIDEVVEGVPYLTQLNIVEKHDIDFVVHGDDTALDASGNDCYAVVKALGKYKEFKRTEGISTTSLITRILHPENHLHDQAPLAHLLHAFVSSITPPPPILDLSTEEPRAIQKCESEEVVYVSGSWDCFSTGHVELMRRARETTVGRKPFLVVGVWSDETVKDVTGEQPLLAMLERVLVVVQCRYTDAVVLSAPRNSSPSFLRSLDIDVIVNESVPPECGVESKQVGEHPMVTLQLLRGRVMKMRSEFEDRQRRKGAAIS